jgi:hypothetical protein
MGRRGIHTGCWCESQQERDHWKTKMKVGDSMKMDLREITWSDVDWIDLVEDRD